MSVRLVWEGKPTQVERLSLPFQTVEMINESRATRQRNRGSLFGGNGASPEGRNLIIWGDNKLVMSSLLKDYAGQIKLIYVDPPFATGSDFELRLRVGDQPLAKPPSILEEHIYRDTWGAGYDSYLSMLYPRLVLMCDLLTADGTIFVHIDRRLAAQVKLMLDEIFGEDRLINEIVWCSTGPSSPGMRGLPTSTTSSTGTQRGTAGPSTWMRFACLTRRAPNGTRDAGPDGRPATPMQSLS